MAKRTFIKVRCGILSPKHRVKLGEALFLFLYILDRADWEDGVIYEWKDECVADELGFYIQTLRNHRKHLEDEGYITCIQKFRRLEITVNKWENPTKKLLQEVNGDNQGDKDGDNPFPPLENHGDNDGDNDGDRDGDSTLSPFHVIKKSDITHQTNSIPQISPSQKLIEKIVGIPPSNSEDVMALDEIDKMFPLEEDIVAAYGWLQSKGRRIYHYRSLVNPIRVSIAKRVQKPPTTLDKSKAAVLAVLEELEAVDGNG